MTKKARKSIDVYQNVTDHIIDLLENAELGEYETPFSQGSGFNSSINPTSGNHYNGMNSIILFLTQQKKNYTSNEWATFKQWAELGANVRKGEKSTVVIYYSTFKTGDTVIINGKEEDETRGFIKQYRVFNADQVDGYEAKEIEREKFGIVERLNNIESFIDATKADIKTSDKGAYYQPELDYINMPPVDKFFETSQTASENYYSTILHELTHWTGHASRCDRLPSRNLSKTEYAFEELVAELGSVFLCEKLGIKAHGRKDHAIYLKSWLKALKNDKTFIFKASTKARQAVEFLEGFQKQSNHKKVA